jgi:hypothetical protein
VLVGEDRGDALVLLDLVRVEDGGLDGLDLPLAAFEDEFEVEEGEALAVAEGVGEDDLVAVGVGDAQFLDLDVRVADEDGVDAADLLGDEGGGVLDAVEVS